MNDLKFLSYEHTHGTAFGAVVADGIVDLSDVGPSLRAVLATGPLDNLSAVVAKRKASVRLDQVVLHQVVPDASRIICVGKNYKDHATEMGGEVPKNPNLFIRTPQSLVGHKQAIVAPISSTHFDFEGELAVIIGKGGRHISKERALSHVAGYSCFMDGSLRDFQKHSFTAGKNFDSSGACGPWLVPTGQIANPHALKIQTRVNGIVMQSASTADMIYTIPDIIAYISAFTHIEPGDVIATGTPAGVAAGRNPPPWLKAGDRVDVEIEGIGTLSNTVIAEIA